MELTGVEKVAVLLIALGQARARPLLEKLGAEDVLRITEAMSRMGSVSPEVRRAVLEEMRDVLSGRKEGLRPNRDTRRERRERDEVVADLLDQLGPRLEDHIRPAGSDWDAPGLDSGEPGDDTAPPLPGGKP